MKFLPFESITYQTKLTKEQVKIKLSDMMETEPILLKTLESPLPKPMEIEGEHFNI